MANIIYLYDSLMNTTLRNVIAIFLVGFCHKRGQQST